MVKSLEVVPLAFKMECLINLLRIVKPVCRQMYFLILMYEQLHVDFRHLFIFYHFSSSILKNDLFPNASVSHAGDPQCGRPPCPRAPAGPPSRVSSAL